MAEEGFKISTVPTSQLACNICDVVQVFLDQELGLKEPLRNDQKFAFFHNSTCTACPPHGFPYLCAICAHLNLAHLFGCRQRFRKAYIRFPSAIDLSQRCDFCEYIGTISWVEFQSRHAFSLYLIRSPDSHLNFDFTFTIDFLENPAAACESSAPMTDLIPSPHDWTPTILSEDQDWLTIKSRLAICDLEHSVCNQRRTHSINRTSTSRHKSPELAELPELSLPSSVTTRQDHSTKSCFRLVDVQRKNLVLAPLKSFFAALSYVWGDCKNSTKLKASRGNVARLMKPGSLTLEEVPKTINDAIEVCSRLDIPYLWVDRLCILQDDEEDIHQQVQSMDTVFSSAYVVLVALVNNMDSGIPGITSPPKVQQAHFDRLQLVRNIFTDPDHLARERDDSMWSTRGWTYQEAVLSRRLLYLSNGHVWVRCKVHATQSEAWAEEDFIKDFGLEQRSKRMEWYHHFKNYLVKDLSMPTDIYNAFSGISNAIYGPDSLYYGLPKDDFEIHLLLKHQGLFDLIRSPDPRAIPNNAPRNFQLPTWSWASVHGGKLAPFSMSQSCLPLVTWAANKPTDEKFFTFLQDECPKISALECAWIQGLFDYDLISTAVRSAVFPPEQTHIWSFLLDTLHSDDTVNDSMQQFPQNLVADFPWDQETSSRLRPGTLLGRVQRAYLHCRLYEFQVLSELPLRTMDKQFAGLLWAQAAYSKEEIDPVLEGNGLFELIALVADQVPLNHFSSDIERALFPRLIPPESTQKLDRLLSDRSIDHNFYDCDGMPLPEIPIVHVMAIGWRGPIAHRITVGWVFLAAWLKLERETITILLE